MKDKYKLSTQLLHAYELRFFDCIGELAELKGLIVRAELPVKFKEIASDMDLLSELAELTADTKTVISFFLTLIPAAQDCKQVAEKQTAK